MGYLSKAAMVRVRRQTLKAERRPRQSPRAAPAPPAQSDADVYMRVTTTITLATATRLGRGAGRIQALTANGQEVDYADASTETFPIYSMARATDATIAVGRIIKVARMGGRFHVDADYCT